MLTRLETKIVRLLYTISCKSITIPFAVRRHGHGHFQIFSTSTTSRRRWIYDQLTWFYLLSTIIFRITQTSLVARKSGVNGVILHGLSLMGGIGNAVFKLNIRTHQVEFVEVLNQVMLMNSTWGNSSVFVA